MSELITYIILFPLVILLYYATFDFIFGNKIKKIGILGFSVEKKMKHDEKLEKKYKVKNSLKSGP